MQEKLRTIISKHTGQSAEQVEKDSDRDFFMSSEAAREYGLVDKVVETLREKKAKEK
ncbi:MAG: ATP-dependent Clp protease proteolytic subunit, partial [Planctomycetes bacterium]|nr:ATP-dependent Clp protease proteolytic subunit [Planctomycetota bacterium]